MPEPASRHGSAPAVNRAFPDFDRAMMMQAIALSRTAVEAGEYPFGALVARAGEVIAKAINHSRRENDASRHAEIVALSEAAKRLGRRKLSDCTLYSTVEPCPMCAFCIREAGIGRVVYGLPSPVMGGVSRWNILGDSGLARILGVFGDAPRIEGRFMQEDAAQVWKDWNPLAWHFIRRRGILGADDAAGCIAAMPRARSVSEDEPGNLWQRLRMRLASLL